MATIGGTARAPGEHEFKHLASIISRQARDRELKGLPCTTVLISPEDFQVLRYYSQGRFVYRVSDKAHSIRGMRAIVCHEVDQPEVLG
jgi:hypothetical protein